MRDSNVSVGDIVSVISHSDYAAAASLSLVRDLISGQVRINDHVLSSVFSFKTGMIVCMHKDSYALMHDAVNIVPITQYDVLCDGIMMRCWMSKNTKLKVFVQVNNDQI